MIKQHSGEPPESTQLLHGTHVSRVNTSSRLVSAGAESWQGETSPRIAAACLHLSRTHAHADVMPFAGCYGMNHDEDIRKLWGEQERKQ